MKQLVLGPLRGLTNQGTGVKALVLAGGLVSLAFTIGFHIAVTSELPRLVTVCPGVGNDVEYCGPNEPDAAIAGMVAAMAAMDYVGLLGLVAASVLLLGEGRRVRDRLDHLGRTFRNHFVAGIVSEQEFSNVQARLRAASLNIPPSANTQRFTYLLGGAFLAFVALYNAVFAGVGFGPTGDHIKPWLVTAAGLSAVLAAMALWASIACFVAAARAIPAQTSLDEALDSLELEALRVERDTRAASGVVAVKKKASRTLASELN